MKENVKESLPEANYVAIQGIPRIQTIKQFVAHVWYKVQYWIAFEVNNRQ